MNVNGGSNPIPKPYFCLYRFAGSGAVQLGSTLYHGANYYMRQEYLDDETVYGEIGIYKQSSQTSVEGTFKVILYQDGDGTWEPYKPLQSLSLQTPNGLPGIPTSSGGNYTDANGQQWICDEIDLKRGVYVQRVGRFKGTSLGAIEINNNTSSEKYIQYTVNNNERNFLEGINTNSEKKSYCTHLVLGNQINSDTKNEQFWIFNKEKMALILLKEKFPTAESVRTWFETSEMEIVAPITPVETPLAEETIQAFKSLRTYYPNTVVTNDADTGMELEYIADTQKYIDNKFAEMNQTIVATQKALL